MRISSVESPSEEMIDPRYLNDLTSSRSSPFINIVVLGAILWDLLDTVTYLFLKKVIPQKADTLHVSSSSQYRDKTLERGYIKRVLHRLGK